MKPRFLFVSLLAVLTGCAALTDTRTPTVEGYEAVRKGPMLPINRSVTSFSDGLRCMDILLVQYGTHASLMVEDLNDKTQKSPAGTTEMFLGALSQMTRRSQAVRTVAFSEDTKNSVNLMRLAGSKDAFQIENIPTYILRGAVSQFDDNLAKKTIDKGISLGPLSFGGAKSSSINMVGLDLVILRAHDFSVVPGVSAHNAAAILQEGEGLDTDVIYKKFGVNFMTSLAKSDGKTVALRNLAELGAIELMGKLNKIPYWKCLGVAGNQPDVVREVDDWWEAMTTADKMRFFLQQFRSLGMVPAASNAPVEPDTFRLAFRVYSEVLGFADNKTLSLGLFRAHFEADPDVVGPKAVALFEAEKQKLLAIELKLEPTRSRDEASFLLTTNHDAFVYCFLQDDENNQIRRILPYGYRAAALLAGHPVALREMTKHAIVSYPRQAQTLACFASAEDRSKDLPGLFRTPVGAAIPRVTDFNHIKSQLAAGGVQLATAIVNFKGHPARPATEFAHR